MCATAKPIVSPPSLRRRLHVTSFISSCAMCAFACVAKLPSCHSTLLGTRSPLHATRCPAEDTKGAKQVVPSEADAPCICVQAHPPRPKADNAKQDLHVYVCSLAPGHHDKMAVVEASTVSPASLCQPLCFASRMPARIKGRQMPWMT